MRYDVVLTDLDGTLFDFLASSRECLKKTFAAFSLPFPEENIPRFFAINESLWSAYAQGKIPRDEIYTARFRRYFSEFGIIGVSEEAINAHYMGLLRFSVYCMPRAKELLQTLTEDGCEIYAVTNGEEAVQRQRIADSGLAPYFRKVYISGAVGTQKPERAFFDAVFSEIGEEKRSRAVIFGDSLVSDMQGGRNAGIATCLYRRMDEPDERCDHAVDDLMDFVSVCRG